MTNHNRGCGKTIDNDLTRKEHKSVGISVTVLQKYLKNQLNRKCMISCNSTIMALNSLNSWDSIQKIVTNYVLKNHKIFCVYNQGLKIQHLVFHKFSFNISRRYLKILPVIKIRVFFTVDKIFLALSKYLKILYKNLNFGVFKPLKHKPVPFPPTTGNYILGRQIIFVQNLIHTAPNVQLCGIHLPVFFCVYIKFSISFPSNSYRENSHSFLFNIDNIFLAKSKYLKIEYKVPHELLKK
ncbi:hypothetical protein AGLY_003011 [Aphis glycines]|uniref:Uncharacterized protein n=1 Tax=Aphis glycines TaxID=307491 RepID=A0A6G0U2U2_APHGL|nr:hypothetical protein AGLY_003011 [Aphis glycines]